MGSTGRRLTSEDIATIRRKYEMKEATFSELVLEFSLSKGGLSNVLKDIPKHGLTRRVTKTHAPKSEKEVKAPPDEVRSRAAKEMWLARVRGIQFSDFKTDRARRRFIIKTAGHKCQCCSLTEWCESLIPLELDHLDGNPENNTRENCRVICPNCHAQTDTYKGRNVGRVQNSKRQGVMARSVGKYR